MSIEHIGMFIIAVGLYGLHCHVMAALVRSVVAEVIDEMFDDYDEDDPDGGESVPKESTVVRLVA